MKGRAVLALLGTVLLFAVSAAWAGQAESSQAEPSMPDAPRPQTSIHVKAPTPGPCQASRSSTAAAEAAEVGAVFGAGNAAAGVIPQPREKPASCPPLTPFINWYARFVTGPKVKPMTPKEKGWLAVRNLVDPFNAVTILGNSAISVGSDADSPYGPGMKGFGRNVGVSYTQDMTGNFFSVFLIPSIVHQDPHYHRMPNASIPRRVGHAILQVVWTQGDNGEGMMNYSSLVGSAIEDEIGDLYVPGQQTNLPATAERYVIGLATAPTDNFITEFLPDVASHIHVRVVLIQQIINKVANTPSPTSP
ncbi:MAG: hypothetical protein ABSE51_02260 [Terracidiphilus sp.]|jgi:hypothetical protein